MMRRDPGAPRAQRGWIGFEFTLVLIAAALATVFGIFERGTFLLLCVAEAAAGWWGRRRSPESPAPERSASPSAA